MSKTLQEGKEKIIIVLTGGNVAAVYSSIPEKSLDVEIINTDSRTGREKTREYVDELIESGTVPYVLY